MRFKIYRYAQVVCNLLPNSLVSSLRLKAYSFKAVRSNCKQIFFRPEKNTELDYDTGTGKFMGAVEREKRSFCCF
jgi:hypothetical protein